MRLCLGLLAAVVLALAGCDRGRSRPADPTRTLTVFAAASLAESFTDIGRRFESLHPGVKVQFNFAGSQQLRAQLEAGAPADVFASANTKEMDAAARSSLVEPAAAHIFAKNRLVVIFPKDNPGRVGSLGDLAKPGLKLDLADESVPVGKYTLAMLDAMGKDAAFGADFRARVLANVVSREENVKAVVMKARLGEVDAGIVYVSDLSGSAGRDLGSLAVPDRFNQLAEYPIAALTKAPQRELAGQFVEFVLSADGQAILGEHGLLPVAPK